MMNKGFFIVEVVSCHRALIGMSGSAPTARAEKAPEKAPAKALAKGSVKLLIKALGPCDGL